MLLTRGHSAHASTWTSSLVPLVCILASTIAWMMRRRHCPSERLGGSESVGGSALGAVAPSATPPYAAWGKRTRGQLTKRVVDRAERVVVLASECDAVTSLGAPA